MMGIIESAPALGAFVPVFRGVDDLHHREHDRHFDQHAIYGQAHVLASTCAGCVSACLCQTRQTIRVDSVFQNGPGQLALADLADQVGRCLEQQRLVFHLVAIEFDGTLLNEAEGLASRGDQP